MGRTNHKFPIFATQCSNATEINVLDLVAFGKRQTVVHEEGVRVDGPVFAWGTSTAESNCFCFDRKIHKKRGWFD